jgi:hypothetical protein
LLGGEVLGAKFCQVGSSVVSFQVEGWLLEEDAFLVMIDVQLAVVQLFILNLHCGVRFVDIKHQLGNVKLLPLGTSSKLSLKINGDAKESKSVVDAVFAEFVFPELDSWDRLLSEKQCKIC